MHYIILDDPVPIPNNLYYPVLTGQDIFKHLDEGRFLLEIISPEIESNKKLSLEETYEKLILGETFEIEFNKNLIFGKTFFLDDPDTYEYLINEITKHDNEHDINLKFLMKQVIRLNYSKVVVYLMEKGVDINYCLCRASEFDKLDMVKFFLDKGADIHTVKEAPLNNAIQFDNFEIIKFLIQNGADISGIWISSWTLAANYDRWHIIKFLMENDSNPGVEPWNIIIDIATRKNNLDIIKFFVNECHTSLDNEIILKWAVKHNNLSILKYIISNGADHHMDNDILLVNAAVLGHLDMVRFLFQENVIASMDNAIAAAMRFTLHVNTNCINVVKFLLENGPGINGINSINNANDINFFLRRVIKKGNFEFAKFFVRQGGILPTDNEIVRAACYSGNVDLVKLLIECGASFSDQIDEYLITAATEEHNEHVDLVKYLVEQGADLHAKNEAALIGAAEWDHLDTVKYLISQGADVHAQNDKAFIYACSNGFILDDDKLELFKFLIDSGADIHANNDRAFITAACVGNLYLVEFLFSKGADIHTYDDEALRGAYENENYDIVKFIEAEIAKENQV